MPLVNMNQENFCTCVLTELMTLPILKKSHDERKNI